MASRFLRWLNRSSLWWVKPHPHWPVGEHFPGPKRCSRGHKINFAEALLTIGISVGFALRVFGGRGPVNNLWLYSRNWIPRFAFCCPKSRFLTFDVKKKHLSKRKGRKKRECRPWNGTFNWLGWILGKGWATIPINFVVRNMIEIKGLAYQWFLDL